MHFIHAIEHATHGIGHRHREVKLHERVEGFAFNAPFVGLELGMAKRGERMAATAGAIADLGSYPAWESGIAATLALIPGLGPIAPIAAMAIAMFPSSITGKTVSYAVRQLTSEGKRAARLQIGGKYTDTMLALNIRNNAMAELTYAAQPARRLLGQEAMFLHR